MVEQKRNYSEEYKKDLEKNKRYTVKIPHFLSAPLDEKLKKENKTFTSLVKEAVEKYLKK